MNLENIINTDRYKGLLVLSDIHAEFGRLVDAVSYAEENDLFIVYIGDLVDGGHQPRETLLLTKKLLDDNKAVLVIGNHEFKHYRGAIGNPIKPNQDHRDTIANAGDEDLFRQLIIDCVTHPNAGHYHYYGKTIFAHGGVHKGLWSYPDTVNSAQRAMSLYGDPSGAKDDRGFPVRLYNWVSYIPNGHQAVVGHDTEALGKTKNQPLRHVTSDNGVVYFTDTGCGKGVPDERLTGTVFLFIDGELEFIRFKAFR